MNWTIHPTPRMKWVVVGLGSGDIRYKKTMYRLDQGVSSHLDIFHIYRSKFLLNILLIFLISPAFLPFFTFVEPLFLSIQECCKFTKGKSVGMLWIGHIILQWTKITTLHVYLSSQLQSEAGKSFVRQTLWTILLQFWRGWSKFWISSFPSIQGHIHLLFLQRALHNEVLSALIEVCDRVPRRRFSYIHCSNPMESRFQAIVRPCHCRIKTH